MATPAKKTPAKKTPVKKAPAKKAPAKKAPAKKAPAKKVPVLTREEREAAELAERKEAAASASRGAKAIMAAMESDDRDRRQRHLETERRRAANITVFEGKETKRGTKYQGDTFATVIVVAALLVSGTSALTAAADSTGTVTGVIYAAVMLVLAYRSYTAAIFVGPKGILVRNPLRTHLIPWTDVRGYAIKRAYGGYRRNVYCLALRLPDANVMKLSAFRVGGRAHDINASIRAAAETIDRQRRQYLGVADGLELIGQPEEVPLNPAAL